jgi:hypothetical protein
LPLALAAAVAAAAYGLARAGGQDAAAEVVVLEPAAGREGRPASLPRGEVPLLQVLKGLADATGKVVVWKASDPVDAKIVLPRAVESLDFRSAAEILEQAGYAARLEEWKGKPAYQVERLPRRKGRIIRESDRKEVEDAGRAPSPGDGGAGGQVQLYAREEGAGRRFIVILETDSREEAEAAVSLLRAHQRSRAEGKKKG